jgi:formate hydrogenlyase transcriptional activator
MCFCDGELVSGDANPFGNCQELAGSVYLTLMADVTNISLEAQLQATLNKIPAYTWYAAPTGGLTFVNTRCADYLGLPSDHPLRFGIDIGAAWDAFLAFLHPDDIDETRRVWSNCLKTGSPGEVSFRARNAAGVYRWFLCRAEPLRANDGTLLYWIGIHLDIQDRKQAEFYLAEGQRLAHTGSWAFTAAGFTHWSPELFAIHGLAPSDRAPSIPEYIALVHPDDREFVAQAIQTMLAEHRGFDFTKRIVRPDGTMRHVRCVGVAATDGEGFVGTGIDVTEQEHLTEALRESEMELRQILDLAPQLIAVLGPKRERLYVNRPALSYLGTTLDEWRRRVMGEPGSEAHPEDAERIKAVGEQAIISGSPYELEVRLRAADGSYRWFLARYNPVRDDQGQIIRWYVACTDIDHRKRAEERMRNETIALREDLDRASMFEEIVGSSPALQRVLAQVAKVAQTDSTVLIMGETGTGKELLARAIHKRSRRASGAFIRVNCAAIPPALIASELFGHEKGAFTGALQRRLGRFEAADGGTIFLDEIGELPPEAQVALLRVMQEREIERVGSSHPVPVDVRVIAATNRDLEAAVEHGAFREDLFYRFNVFPIRLPPLRERAEDIPILVEYLVDHYAKQVGKTIRNISKQTLQLLQAYDWPGNVRELQNVIERAIVLSEGETFLIDHSWLATKRRKLSKGTGRPVTIPVDGEKVLIEAALTESQGRVSGPRGAAAKLGIPRQTLEWKIRTLNIDKLAFRKR